MKNILVIGSTGQIGSELTRELRARYGNEHVVAGYITGAEPKGELKDGGPSALADVTDGAGWPVVDQESVINANPDLIIAFDSNGMGDMDAAQVITAREGWQDMDAVKNGHVYVLVNNEFVRPGPRLADAAESLMELIESLSVEEPAA